MIYDISRTITEETYVYPDDPKFKIQSVCNEPFKVSLFTMGSHTGTHIDAPMHFFKDMNDISSIDLERICGKCKVINIPNKMFIEKQDILKYKIDKNDIIIFKTMNSENFDGENPISEYCSLTYECACYLVQKEINLVGIDYISIESESSTDFCVHKKLLGNNIPIVENLDLNNINEGEYNFYCLPLKIKYSDGCPVRCILEK